MKLVIFGMGYTARALMTAMRPFRFGTVVGTTRSPQKAEIMGKGSVDPRVFPGTDMRPDLEKATHVLITAGPEDGADPVLARLRPEFEELAARFTWVGYLSTTGVYGDHKGGWVDETTPLAPTTARGRARMAAEMEWNEIYRLKGLPLHIFRLPGIYGPGRGPFQKVKSGSARAIIKQGQVFSRIHVDDIAQALLASMKRPRPGAIYNICDDDPAPPQDVLRYAAELLGQDPPEEVPFEEAELSPMARSFYSESKRVDNTRMKRELRVKLRYPTYKAGLRAILDAEGCR